MTAEIVIINQHGVAMAADSAVTIGSQKIINSAIKLFSLSRTEPVGIMIYGNANLLNIPWETLIKLYRKKNTSSLNHLNDYGENFIEFLNSQLHLFSDEQQNDWAEWRISDIYNYIIEQIKAELTQLQNKGVAIDEVVISKHAESIILEYKNVLETNKQVYEGSIDEKLLDKIESIANPLIDTIFPFTTSKIEVRDFLIRIGQLAVLNCAPLNSSGIVIAGFGDNDIFPSVLTYEIYGVFNSQLLHRIRDDKTIINENSKYMRSDIIPYAQEDVVRSFLDGMHPDLYTYVTEFTENTIKETLSDPLFEFKNNIDINLLSKACAESLRQELERYMASNLLSPMVEMIKALPKDELASMAEALVNMTAFRRKMAFGSQETVGGPVDVAVISKGDGLVWVKRKHYFPKELNTHFFENYFK
ncbi:TPA: hypothetical protein PKT84_000396 [Acinetobacter baumannii]|nr:hypothetical protein [Acinetobacter baumannii]HDI2510252.1 hypothetical protein [Acinetobacter baumannii]HDI2806423.1 hypothetical protein [Acinetobacter baumannii]HDI2810305.1 hypothetical protein [Acinetobacter baumannii]HDI2822420.1 hypothetical protein [Acinetobacter baumannii]